MANKRTGADGNAPQSKRVKFSGSSTVADADKGGDDEFGFKHQEDFDEAISESLEKDKRTKQRRRGFKMDGYGSADSASDISEDDDEGSVDRSTLPVAADDEDEDMFGKDEDDDSLKPKSKSKQQQKLSITQQALEAQEENPSEENQFTVLQYRKIATEGDSSIDVEEQEGVASKKHIPIEPFNLKEEMQEGSFDTEGVYTEHKDENRHHDSWLQGISAGDIQKAAKAHRQWEEQAKQRAAEEMKRTGGPKTRSELLAELLEYLQPGENALKLMQRLRLPTKLKKQKQQVVSSPAPSPANTTAADQNQNKAIIERVTEIADRLMQLGHFSAYEDSVEEIRGFLNESKPANAISSGGKERPSVEEQMWQYKWQPDGAVFGPFTSQEMQSWSDQGFFTTPVLVRPVRRNPAGDYSPLSATFQPSTAVRFFE